jgi:hypothetical protein
MNKTNSSSIQIPGFLLNSVPKSGTHLMKQILLGLPNITHNPEHAFYEGLRHNDQENLQKLKQMKPNTFAAGHVYYSKEWASMLRQLGIKHIFIIRDLRDIVISYTHFIVEKYPYHPLREYMTQQLKTSKERYMTLIQGIKIKDLNYPNIAEWYTSFHGWLNDPNALILTFEELMGSAQTRRLALIRIANFLWEDRAPSIGIPQMVQRMNANIKPSKSITYRTGKIGNWKKEFDQELKTTFKKIAGPILIQTHYEKNHNW